MMNTKVATNILRFPCAVALIFLLIGCAPRGESKSVAEIYEGSKERFASASREFVATGASEAINQIDSLLSKMEADMSVSSAQQNSAEIATALNSLILKAGYTARPALGEIVLQYRLIASGEKDRAPSESHLRLLMARTYRLLAQELETTRFQV